jgi:hypothetical protein
MNKLTPHLYVAAVIVVVALVLGVSPLLTGAGSYRIDSTEQKVVNVQYQDIVPAATAIEPLNAELSAGPDGNPFTLRKAGTQHNVKIPLPPAPPLQVPAPPVLPISRK